MSKKNRTGKTEDLFRNIGDRMKKNKQSSEDTDPPENEAVEEATEATEPIEKEIEEKEVVQQETSSWGEKQSYRSSFIVTGEMEDDFEACKRKFRRNLRSNLSKQSAIELGWKLLSSLDDEYFEEVKATHSPDDDLVQALKNVIEEYY